LNGGICTVKWISCSLKSKAFIVLAIFGIIPLLVFGFITNRLATNALESKLSSMADQTIDKLSISISKDLQGFVDMVFYHTRNYKICDSLTTTVTTEQEKQLVFYNIRSEILQNQVVRRINYPFHYLVISRDDNIYTNFSYSSKGNYGSILKNINSENWYTNLKESYSQQILLFAHNHFLSPRKEKQLYIASNIMSNTENLGVLVLGIDEYYLSRFLKNVRISDRTSLYITDKDGRCLVEGENNHYDFDSLPATLVSMIKNGQEIPRNMKIDGLKQMVVSSQLYLRDVQGSWRILMITPLEDIRKDINKINYVTIIFVVLSLVAAIFLIFLVNMEVISPVIKLNRLTKEVQKGNLDVKAAEYRKDEIGQLGHGFNNMVVNLKDYITSIQEDEKAKRELEIKMLQTQINPHFVKNTLNVIRWMAEMIKAPGISQAISAFIKLLDYNFAKSGSMVTVAEEVTYLEEYMYLQKLRYQNKFCSMLEIDDNILNNKILRLSLQPVVENSIIHGFDKKKGLGTILIKGYREGNDLIFKIRDDGVGIPEEVIPGLLTNVKSHESNSKGLGGIGIANVQQRIKLNFGERYGIDIKSETGVGTEVTIVFPVILMEERKSENNENTYC
jgi:Predicted signal transduction protein with a C-terminal ATPase domain